MLNFACLINYKKDNGRHLQFGQGFRLGMLFYVAFALFVVLYSVIYYEVINPEFMDIMMEDSVRRMEDRGMSDEEIDMAMQYSEIFTKTPMMMLIGFLTNMFIGMIVSSIATALIKTPSQD